MAKKKIERKTSFGSYVLIALFLLIAAVAIAGSFPTKLGEITCIIEEVETLTTEYRDGKTARRVVIGAKLSCVDGEFEKYYNRRHNPDLFGEAWENIRPWKNPAAEKQLYLCERFQNRISRERYPDQCKEN